MSLSQQYDDTNISTVNLLETKEVVISSTAADDVDKSDRILARITPIMALEAIDGADKIILATVMDWKVIVRKTDNFSVGDLAIYFAIDSLLEDYEETKHLKGKPLKTIKMRGVYSQGLLVPLSWLLRYDPDAAKDNYSKYKEDMDVTSLMKVTRDENFRGRYPRQPKVAHRNSRGSERNCLAEE